jgi:predicted TIM-barrel fold metal-dependent hydrolase
LIIDVHTHAFPDRIAERAMATLEAEVEEVKAVLDGRLSSLLGSMDGAGIEISVLASIATKPSQFPSILEWSKEIRSARIVPFPSVHPEDPEAVVRVGQVADAGFRGMKLHPYYQQFTVDEPGLFGIYEEMASRGLVLLLHSGFDVAFPRDRIADAVRIRRVIDAVPELTVIAAHFGGWEDWDQVEAHLAGRDIYFDVSYSLGMISDEQARRILAKHPRDRVLFGTDSPWAGQAETVSWLHGLGLPEDREEAILSGNARRLLGL